MKEQTRFIICADARTGSHMLQTALHCHPDINCLGEILNPGSKDTFLNHFSKIESVTQAFNSEKQTTGFILHRHRNDLPEIWQYLSENTDIKIIFTHRENKLLRYASFKKAKLTKNWIDKEGKPVDDKKVKFISAEFIELNNKYDENRIQCNNLFSAHQSIQVKYEDMLINWSNLIYKVQQFLSVVPILLQPQTFKQGKNKLTEIFENYEDIDN